MESLVKRTPHTAFAHYRFMSYGDAMLMGRRRRRTELTFIRTKAASRRRRVLV
jgi:hypothetical protein